MTGAALYTLLSVMFINPVGFGIVVPLLPFYAKSFSAPPWQRCSPQAWRSPCLRPFHCGDFPLRALA